MAKQHFYSRVPARGSLYNRADGFDTFAHSQGLSREFIERELSAVYENKLTKQDGEAIRTGKMPAVYSQSCLKSGALVQSCVSYLPKDYTGERSAYLCHSLILSEEEQKAVFCQSGISLLNPAMFVSDPSVFDLSTQGATADYPEKDYTPCAGHDPAYLAEHYAPEAVKAFLFAVLSALCGKGKTVYFKLPCKDEDAPVEALKMMNMVTSVVPYHLRKSISFVTYVTDPAQYNHVKIKCVCADCPETALSKGIFVDFGTDIVTGMPAADVVAKIPVNFFYSLLSDASIRGEFLRFVDKAVDAVPELEKLNPKTLADLVFLFGGASGLYDQDKILPTDEDVLIFLSSYEKYRAALGEESRRNAYKCLERYPQKHIAIPKTIFAKVSKLYNGEMPSAKRMVMNVVLELIHTDVMRDKLFTFLKNNYDGEDADIQAVITADLCRVYYGGFLQSQILDFFGQHFAAEPEEAQNAIFEKLMLTIRTVAIQDKILSIVAANYGSLTAMQKAHLYEMIFEMMPECDKLSAALVTRINEQMKVEDNKVRSYVTEKLTELLTADYKKKEHKLMPLLSAEPGFCRDLVVTLAFGEWSTRKIHEEYIAQLCGKKIAEKAEMLLYIAKTVPGEKTDGLLTLAVEPLFGAEAEKTTLYQWLAVEEYLQTEFAGCCIATWEILRDKIIHPGVMRRIDDIYAVKLNKDGIEVITRYAKDNAYLRDSRQYKAISILRQLMDAVESADAGRTFRTLWTLLQEKGDFGAMAEYLLCVRLSWEIQPPEQGVLWCFCGNALKTGKFLSPELYQQAKSRYAHAKAVEDPKLTGAKLTSAAACGAAERILQYLMWACAAEPAMTPFVCADKEGMAELLRSFSEDYGRGMDKWVLGVLSNASEPILELVTPLLEENKPKGNNLFAKLFGKK